MTQYLGGQLQPAHGNGSTPTPFQIKASVPAEGPFAGAETDCGRRVVRRLSAPAGPVHLATPCSTEHRDARSGICDKLGITLSNVGLGSKTVLTATKRDFRSTPNNGHYHVSRVGPFRARFRLVHRSKQLRLFDHFVRAGEQKMRDCDLAELTRVERVNFPKAVCA